MRKSQSQSERPTVSRGPFRVPARSEGITQGVFRLAGRPVRGLLPGGGKSRKIPCNFRWQKGFNMT
jgi:hypothetical protein